MQKDYIHNDNKDPVVHMWEFGGLWKQQNSPACTKASKTKSVRVFSMFNQINVDTIRKKKNTDLTQLHLQNTDDIKQK